MLLVLGQWFALLVTPCQQAVFCNLEPPWVSCNTIDPRCIRHSTRFPSLIDSQSVHHVSPFCWSINFWYNSWSAVENKAACGSSLAAAAVTEQSTLWVWKQGGIYSHMEPGTFDENPVQGADCGMHCHVEDGADHRDACSTIPDTVPGTMELLKNIVWNERRKRGPCLQL